MEVKEIDGVVITKPVASRPSCSSFRSFSELLAGAINASPSPANACSETAIAAIRPKTVRVNPTANRASIAMLSSQGEASGAAALVSFDNNSKLSKGKSSVVYKPLAKVVSKATVLLLANMGSPNITHQQVLTQVEAQAQYLNQSKLNVTNQPISNQPPSVVPPAAENAQSAEPPKRASDTVEEEPKPFTSSANVDRPSYDGYNWRKYGQKQVKGSEYPRSYYKCTHPNCPVKKKVERSFDGQIAEIVYKGVHNHPKPQPPKRSSPGAQCQGLTSDGTRQDQNANNPKRSNNISEMNEGSEGCVENHGGGVRLATQATNPNKSQLLFYDPGTTGACSIDGKDPDNPCDHSADCKEGSKGLEVDDDKPKSKRRKSGNQNNELATSGEGIQETGISVQNTTQAEILGDGFRWRKYGQKVVKGNPYPRSYYKCTSLRCNVRKHIERASDDPSAFITTYEGKHNHDMPLKVPNSAASQPDPQTPPEKK